MKFRQALMPLSFVAALALFAGVAAKADPATYLALDRAYMGDGIDGTYAEIKALAETGDPIGLFRLAYLTYAGWGVERDPVAAVPLYEKALAGGYGLAAHNLAVIHLEDSGLPRDEVKGRAYMTEAARLGIPEAEISLYAERTLGRLPASLYQLDTWVKGRQIADGPAVEWLRCRFIHEGLRDAEKAEPHCRAAAEAGVSEAMVRYGLMQTARATCKTPTCQFYDGFNRRIVLAPPLNEAFRPGIDWLIEAGEADNPIGHLEARRALAIAAKRQGRAENELFENGIRVALRIEPRVTRAYVLASLNAIKPLTDKDPAPLPVAARALTDSANAGDPLAQVSVASLYLHGWGVERDAEKAAAWMAVAEDSQPDAWYGDYGDLVLEDLAMLRRNIGLSLTADQRLAADQQAALLRRQVADQLAKVFSDPTTSN